MRAIAEDIRQSIQFPYKKDIQFLFSSRTIADEVEKIYVSTLGLAREMIQMVYDHRVELEKGDLLRGQLSPSLSEHNHWEPVSSSPALWSMLHP
jgi:hypothetical protein